MKLHPIFVLLGVMFAGIVVWPALKREKIVAGGLNAEALVAAGLIITYMAYKAWWEKRNKK